jgi:phosphinothricin acetyltransferase
MNAARDLTRACERMRSDRAALAAVVNGLKPADFGVARPGGWSVRRVLEHVIESEAAYARLLAHLCGAPQPELEAPTPETSVDAVRALQSTRAAVEAAVTGIDGDTLYRLSRVGHDEYSPLSVLENVALHDREHIGQIEELLREARAESRATRATPEGLIIRPAVDADLPRLTAIYNHYVEHTPTTFDIDPFTPEQRRAWFDRYATTGRHRLLVAEVDDAIAGYASTSPFHAREAYETTVEMTVLCAPESVGRGLGRALYERLFEAIAGEDIHAAVAAITMPNDASVALHEAFGFRRTAVLEEVGRKFDRYWDVLWMSRTF